MIKKGQPSPRADKKAYTVREFCELYSFSRSELYTLWARNEGPRFKRIGQRKIIILVDDAEEWSRHNRDGGVKQMGA